MNVVRHGTAHRPSPITRRKFLGLSATAVGAAAVPAWLGSPARAADTDVLSWINEHAMPLARTDAHGPVDDLRGLRDIVRDAHVVGLGESAHGTHTELTLKHRVARYLVEHLGFRTIAWEEGWGSGVAIDRYVTSGDGDPRAVVGDAMFMLRTEAMLDLVGWMRDFNRGRPDHDKVRFLGADVVELRAVQFAEIRRYVADVAPARLAELDRHLAPIGWRGGPFEQLGWYMQLTEAEKRAVIAHARAVDDLVRGLTGGHSVISRYDAVQHAHAVLGFYESYTEAGEAADIRDRYIAEIVTGWQRRTGHRVIYSAANAHTAACPRALISFPDDEPGDDTAERAMAGGRLRRRYGRRYVSIGTVFHHGQVLTGWEVQPGGPAVYDVPAPHGSFVDATLGQARQPDYLLDLRRGAPASVRLWLDGPARMRIIGSAYDAGNDANYSQSVDSWREAFDAILHVNHVTASRLLPG